MEVALIGCLDQIIFETFRRCVSLVGVLSLTQLICGFVVLNCELN